jgi:DNA end-binding protein Ku
VPRRKQTSRRETAVPASEPSSEASTVRGHWSGNLSFGLVSIPVTLVTAQRSERVALKMLSPEGKPLRRRFFSSTRGRALENDEIVRGYEVEPDRFVAITDDELKAIAPKLSQEIDLRRFVPLSDIDPMFFERGYFMVPGKRAGKAYRLLAHIMEERQRAGIATFVMREKEYLVAITARDGLLRAETLRFSDELRDAGDLGLPRAAEADDKQVRAFEIQIDKLRTKAFDAADLEDAQAKEIHRLIEKKRKAGKDVIAAPAEVETEDGGSAEIVDLMKYLKESVTGERSTPRERRQPIAAKRKPTKKAKVTKRRKSAAKS